MTSELEHHEQFILELLYDSTAQKAEALNWLQNSGGGNTLGELDSTEESVALVAAIYAAGAEEVIAIEIDDYDGAQNTGKLLIKLPQDEAARRSVFAWHDWQAESMGFDAEPDMGQSYLFSMLD